MKSNKQRRAELKQRRLRRALQARPMNLAPTQPRPIPTGTAPADRTLLARFNNTYGPLPAFYLDRPFMCRDCGAHALWTAEQQKWWYEVAHGPIDSCAVRCLACRRAHRARMRAAGPGAALLRDRAAYLRALGQLAPNAEAVTEIEAALQSKWWGLRVVAIQTLARWGGEANVERLKAFMAGRPEGGRGYWAWERVAADAATRAFACSE